MTVIALDIGNTRLGAGLFTDGKAVDPAQRINCADWQAELPGLLRTLMDQSSEKIDGVAVSSVFPALTGPVCELARRTTGSQVLIAGVDMAIPVKTALADESTVGTDRLLGALSAYVNTEQACVIISAGTALVVDCIDDNGLFLGGAIGPGLQLCAKALHDGTAQLPVATLDPVSDPLGKNTMEALNSGIYAMARGGVRELVEKIADGLGRWPHVVATGGDARRLLADSGLVDSFIPDLALQGAALLWEHCRANQPEK